MGHSSIGASCLAVALFSGCGDDIRSPASLDARVADAAMSDSAVPDAGVPDVSVGLPYLELPLYEDYNHASETTIAAFGDHVVVTAIYQEFPSADAWDYPTTDDDNSFRRVAVAASHDRGLSFGPPQRIPPDDGRTDPVVVAAADGTFWLATVNPTTEVDGDLTKSTDGGDTWSHVVALGLRDKEWVAVDEVRQVVWVAGVPAHFQVAFDGAVLATALAPPGLGGNTAGYADAAGSHFLDLSGSIQAWDGASPPVVEDMTLFFGDLASTWTFSAAAIGLAPDGSEWVVHAQRFVDRAPIVLRLRRMPGDPGTVRELTEPGATAFLPAAAMDASGRLHVVWYESTEAMGVLVYSRSVTADLTGPFTEPMIVDADACPGASWYPGSSGDEPPGQRRLREYIGVAASGNRAHISWTHAPDPPSRVRVTHIDF